MVLADTGVCLIDEFEKMTDQDRTSILEAMEQQSISVSKAGIVTSLQARCTVMAAANPVRGRYDASRSFLQNVDLTEPILSRFDILIVLRDTVSPIVDEHLAQFVVRSHARSHPDTVQQVREAEAAKMQDEAQDGVLPDGTLSQALLRKYITYAKQKCKPKLANLEDEKDRISRLYADLRTSAKGGGMPMTVRHVESTIRLAEANAKMHLRDFVQASDVDMAIQVMLDSFISAQKFSVARPMRKKFHKYLAFQKEPFELLLYVLNSHFKETLHYQQLQRLPEDPEIDVVRMSVEDFATRAREVDVSHVASFYKSPQFLNNGFQYDAANGLILRPL